MRKMNHPAIDDIALSQVLYALSDPVRLDVVRTLARDGVASCSALDGDGDILDFDMAEVRVSRAILRQARERWLVTDVAKLEQRAPIRVVSLAELDAVFIDQPLPGPLASLCADSGTRVVVA